MPFNLRMQSCSALVFILSILIAAESINAAPGINFVAPTPENGTVTTNTSAVINVSVMEQNLGEFIFNWNGTNYTFYNDSLVLMMNFDNASALGENSTRVVDLSRYGNNGTVTGATFDASGKYGTAMSFDGGNDYVTTNLTNLSGSEITIAYWFKGSTIQSAVRQQVDGGTDFIIAGYTTDGAGPGIHALSNDGRVAGGITIDGNSGNTAIDGNWHYLVMAWKQNTTNGFNSYFDGVLVANRTSSDTPLPDIATFVEFGRYQGIPSENTLGLIDEIKIFKLSLSAFEIRQSYYSNLNKYDTDKWRFVINESDLSAGNYAYRAFAKDLSGSENQTETRQLTVQASYFNFNMSLSQGWNLISIPLEL